MAKVRQVAGVVASRLTFVIVCSASFPRARFGSPALWLVSAVNLFVTVWIFASFFVFVLLVGECLFRWRSCFRNYVDVFKLDKRAQRNPCSGDRLALVG